MGGARLLARCVDHSIVAQHTGPFHTGGADLAGFGPKYSGSLVSMDEGHADVVFRQPVTAEELSSLIEAAMIDPFSAMHATATSDGR